MRFQKVFSRWKGATPTGGITVGADGVPTGVPSTFNQAKGNVLSYLLQSPTGWPVHRIAVGYTPPVVVPATVLGVYGTMYIYDAESALWYRMGEGRMLLQPKALTYFDSIAPGSRAVKSSTLGDNNSPSADVALFIEDPGSMPDGEHKFAMVPDLTLMQESSDEVAQQLQAADVVPVAVSDTVDLIGGITKGIWMPPGATPGNIKVIMESGATRTLPVVADKEYVWRIRRVFATDTTASGFYTYH